MRIESLTFFRFIAALIVVIFHFGKDATGFKGMLIAGSEMVTFFFVLSGFVMSISHFERNIKISSYIWARVSRIVPIYMVAIILIISIDLYKGESIWWSALLLNATFLQSWFSPYPLSINYPGWSLSVEAFFYLIFPFVLLYIKKNEWSVKSTVTISLACWLMTQLVLTNALSNGSYNGSPSLSHDLIFYFPISHLCSFLLGISGGVWLLKNNACNVSYNYFPQLLAIVSALLIIFVLNNKSQLIDFIGIQVAFGSSFLAPLFLSFIVSLSLCRSKVINLLGSKTLVLLGEASFSLYILQVPVYRIHNILISSFFSVSPLANFLTYLMSLILISILAFLYFEKPANKFVRYTLPKLFEQYIGWRNARTVR